MKVNYDKTTYEKLLDILEDATLSGRSIKNIEVTKDEWKWIMTSFVNSKFLQSISRKIYIKNIRSVLESDVTIKAHIDYMVIESPYQQSAKLNFVTVVIV